jgi:alpha-glucosidase/alpha-D-xyloside xylohydrolase
LYEFLFFGFSKPFFLFCMKKNLSLSLSLSLSWPVQYMELTSTCIITSGISIAYEDYGTYERGLKADIFLKNPKGENYLAQVWPGPVYFPDFLNPKTTEWWMNEVQMFHDKIPIDGMWIDMNEVSNFCTGTFCSWNGTLFEDSDQCYLHCSSTVTKWDDPPFKINHMGTYQELGYKTAAMTVKHYDGSLEYNAHSLYGIAESIATNIALTKVRKKRSFLLSRSTFIGSGAHTAHWTGDDGASFEDLAYSIVTILNSGIFGVPMVGADICGFYGTPTEDLCGRWIQTGAFYPFSRAHNVRNNPGKEFYRWKSVTKSARKALGLRYRLLPYFYTLNFEAHTTGAPIARPLFFSFPDDPEALKINFQFLIGSSILISPVVQANTTSVHAYFPKGTWYNLYDWSSIISTGSSFILQAPWDVINVHVHEGSIIPMQESLLTSALVRKSLFTLVVAFPAAASNCESSSSSATGHLFLDDGDDIKMELTDGKSTHVLFSANLEAAGNGFIKSQVVYGKYALKENWVVQTVVILGVRIKPNTVLIHQEARAAEAHVKVTHAGEVPSLHLSGLNLLMGKGFEITWMPK